MGEETRAKFDEALYLPYAEWLAVHDKFDEALEAYRKSGREDRAARMMQQLTFNAVVESRFKDASYYYWLLASETLRVAAKKDNLQKLWRPILINSTRRTSTTPTRTSRTSSCH